MIYSPAKMNLRAGWHRVTSVVGMGMGTVLGLRGQGKRATCMTFSAEVPVPNFRLDMRQADVMSLVGRAHSCLQVNFDPWRFGQERLMSCDSSDVSKQCMESFQGVGPLGPDLIVF